MSTALVKFLIKNYNASSDKDEEVYVEIFGDEFRDTSDQERFSIMLRHYQQLTINSNEAFPKLEETAFKQFTYSNSESILKDYIEGCLRSLDRDTLYHKYRMMIETYSRKLLDCSNNYTKFQKILEDLQREQFNRYNDVADLALYQAMHNTLEMSVRDHPLKAKFHRELLELSPKASFTKKLEAYLEALA